MNKQGEKRRISIFPVLALVAAVACLAAAIFTVAKPGREVFKSIKVEGSTIYYTKSAGIKMAQKAGDTMKKYGIIKSDHEINVRVEKKDGTYVISFVAAGEGKYIDMMKLLFAEILKMMRAGEFAGEKVMMMICRGNFTGCESVE